MANNYPKEKKWVEDKLASGTTKFSRSEPYIQTLLNASNLSDVESFIQTTGLRSRLY